MHTRRPLVAALLLLGMAGAQQAATPLKLVLSLGQVETVTVDGVAREQVRPAPKAVTPGTLLEQQLQATNTGAAKLTAVRLNLPVPAGTTYLSQAGAPASTATEFSADGGKTYAAAPLTRKVTATENGVRVTRDVVVPPSEYTNVRWTVPTLGAGQVLKLSLRVRVK